MTAPCVNPAHFYVTDDGEIVPQPWMQHRPVLTLEAPGGTTEYGSAGGGAKNDGVHILNGSWTNNSPVPQLVYGLMTAGGRQVVLQARSRAYLEYRHGFNVSRTVSYDFEGGVLPWTPPPLYTTNTTNVHSGSGGFKLGPTPSVQNTGYSAPIPVKVGDFVRLGVWAFRDAAFNGTSNTRIRVTNQGGGTGYVGRSLTPAAIGTQGVWVYLEATLTVPSTDYNGFIQWQLVNDNTEGNLWIDDVTITVNGKAADQLTMEVADRFGGGADIGQGGLLAVGTGFCNYEQDCPQQTIPFMPHLTGWTQVLPGETFTARVELWFKSTFWENTSIDGGDQGTEAYFVTEGTRLDLFAVPEVDPPIVRSTPSVRASSKVDGGGGVTAPKPTGTVEGDVMVAIVAATGQNHSNLAAPAGWSLLADRDAGANRIHLKVFTKTAGASEPASYAFTVPTGPLTAGHVQIVTIAGADVADGADVSLMYTGAPLLFGDPKTEIPSIVSYKKLMIAFSLISHTPLQGHVQQEVPPGTIQLQSATSDFTTLTTAYQLNPPNPTGERFFKADQAIHLGDGRITGVVTVTGPVVP